MPSSQAHEAVDRCVDVLSRGMLHFCHCSSLTRKSTCLVKRLYLPNCHCVGVGVNELQGHGDKVVAGGHAPEDVEVIWGVFGH